jgi:hypothetical protein
MNLIMHHYFKIVYILLMKIIKNKTIIYLVMMFHNTNRIIFLKLEKDIK